MRTLALAFALSLWSTALMAVEPHETLEDPVLEDRAREISQGLRCPVCQNESIDESHAEVARDIRLLVRERLLTGADDEAVTAAVVERYGEFVLLRPSADGANLVLWLAGPAMLIGAAALGWATVRHRPAPAPALSGDEEARLHALLEGRGSTPPPGGRT